MKGDFSRDSFRVGRHYRLVKMQQGRPQLDAEYNEQGDIQFHYEQAYLFDLAGKNGTNIENDGFKILSNFTFNWNSINSGNNVVDESLRQFLRNNFGLHWIENQRFDTPPNLDTISISKEDHHIVTIIRDRANNKATLSTGKDSKKRDLYEFRLLGDGNTVYSRGFLISAGKRDIGNEEAEIDRDGEDESRKAGKTFRGRYYVEGVLCENEFEVETTRQPDLLLDDEAEFFKLDKSPYSPPLTNPALPSKPGIYLAYLDVWQKHVTILEDQNIQEKALGDFDTTTRAKIAWQVKLVDVENAYNKKNGLCNIWNSALKEIKNPTTGMMKVRAKPSPDSKTMCDPYETGGYQKLENQLYRVEVHTSGELENAKLKWSRDNGTIVSKVVQFLPSKHQIKIENRGRDKFLDFAKDQWVEVSDELHENLGIPGTLVKLEKVEDRILTYYSSTVDGKPIIRENYAVNPKVRRWESKDDKPLINSAMANAEGYIELEEGVQVSLSDGHYRCGDYWLAPARTRIGNVEWPQIEEGLSGVPLAMPLLGVVHYYAPLAIVERDENGFFKPREDLRSFFSSLTELINIQYAGGDGQEALPNNTLAGPLRVIVTVGGIPHKKAKVRFTIKKFPKSSPGKLESGSEPFNTAKRSIVVPTNDDGIAECKWTLGEGLVNENGDIDQMVVAVLLDQCGNPTDRLPINFTATQHLSLYYVKGDGEEASSNKVIDIAAGVKVGNVPVKSFYKVRFTPSGEGDGSVPPSSVGLNLEGIASCQWTLAPDNHRQQAFAKLVYPDDSVTNCDQIVYFNAIPRSTSSSANTGLLELEISPNNDSKIRPLKYGKFEHKLPELVAPPAVMLGYISNDKENKKVENTEDHFFFDYILGYNDIIHYKPVEITTSHFWVEIMIGRQEPPRERTFTVSTNKAIYSRGDTIVVSGNIGGQPAEDEKKKVKVEIFLPNGDLFKKAMTAPVVSDGSYELPVKLPVKSKPTIYTIKATHPDTGNVTTTTIMVLKNSFFLVLRWWAIPAVEQDLQIGKI